VIVDLIAHMHAGDDQLLGSVESTRAVEAQTEILKPGRPVVSWIDS
jgi:hypothetical protein